MIIKLPDENDIKTPDDVRRAERYAIVIFCFTAVLAIGGIALILKAAG